MICSFPFCALPIEMKMLQEHAPFGIPEGHIEQHHRPSRSNFGQHFSNKLMRRYVDASAGLVLLAHIDYEGFSTIFQYSFPSIFIPVRPQESCRNKLHVLLSLPKLSETDTRPVGGNVLEFGEKAFHSIILLMWEYYNILGLVDPAFTIHVHFSTIGPITNAGIEISCENRIFYQHNVHCTWRSNPRMIDLMCFHLSSFLCQESTAKTSMCQCASLAVSRVRPYQKVRRRRAWTEILLSFFARWYSLVYAHCRSSRGKRVDNGQGLIKSARSNSSTFHHSLSLWMFKISPIKSCMSPGLFVSLCQDQSMPAVCVAPLFPGWPINSEWFQRRRHGSHW